MKLVSALPDLGVSAGMKDRGHMGLLEGWFPVTWPCHGKPLQKSPSSLECTSPADAETLSQVEEGWRIFDPLLKSHELG